MISCKHHFAIIEYLKKSNRSRYMSGNCPVCGLESIVVGVQPGELGFDLTPEQFFTQIVDNEDFATSLPE